MHAPGIQRAPVGAVGYLRAAGFAVATVMLVLLLSGCYVENSQERAWDRAVGDAAGSYAEVLSCIQESAGGVGDAEQQLEPLLACFGGEGWHVEPGDKSGPFGRGSFLLESAEGGDSLVLEILSVGIATASSAGGSASESAAACWTIRIDLLSGELGEPEPVECESEVLEQASGSAPDVGLKALQSRAPERDS
ncbi:hypothetical protein LGT39_04555 [Demequina sp. TTPB684]|uniref:hypothetical protein n=1 Tax=unclassified Demequina TaxID=2620311 RepID=UPI001CF26BF5|nr:MULTISPECIES: hypothetical protein [unclassified Demequina]MCB2412119.1 hypothetical protein [Demequina sp. TTPB684]UPU88906.1 hypothetical protein LGT36_003020 [Demequina sp. TMPB413]